MEEDFKKEYSGSEEVPDELIEQELEHAADEQMEKIILRTPIPERLLSPIREPQTLSKVRLENSPNKAISTGDSQQPDIFYRLLIEAFEKQTNYISDKSNATLKTPSKKILACQSPPKALNRKTQVAGSCAESDQSNEFHSTISDETRASASDSESDTDSNNLPNTKIIEKDARPGRKRGKEAANQKYRYKKRSKTDVSSKDALDKESPSETIEGIFKLESKSPESRSPETEWSKTSVVVKVNGTDSSERNRKRKLDEPSAGTSGHSNLFRNEDDDDDDLNFSKKQKLEDDEEMNRGNPILSEMLSVQDHDEEVNKRNPILSEILSVQDHESLDLASFMDSPQRRNQRKHSTLLTSDRSYVGRCLSPIEEEDEPTSGNEDVLPSDEAEPFFSIVSNSSASEKRETSCSSVNDLTDREKDSSSPSISNLAAGEKESSSPSVSNLTTSEREESSHPSISNLTSSEKEESSSPSVSNSSASVKGESSRATVSNPSLCEREDSAHSIESNLLASRREEPSRPSVSNSSASEKESSRTNASQDSLHGESGK